MKTTFALMLLAVIISSVTCRRISPIRSDKEADPANSAQEYLTDNTCGSCFQECFLPGDGIQQIDICADECGCGRKRSIKAYSDYAYLADPAECGKSECFQNCYEDGDSAEQIHICSHECQCTF